MISDYDIHLAILSDFCSMDNYVLEPERRRAVSLFQEEFLWKCGRLYTTKWEHIILFCIFPIKFCILIETWSRRGDALLALSTDDDDEVFSNHNSFYNLRLNEGFLSQHPTCVPTPRNEKIGCLLVPSKRTHDSTVTNVLENGKKNSRGATTECSSGPLWRQRIEVWAQNSLILTL